MPRSRAGFSIIEMMVAGALMVLVLGLAFVALIPGMRTLTRSQKQSEAQQAALVVVNRLREEMRCAKPDLIDVQECTFTPPRGDAVRADRVRLYSWKNAAGQPCFTSEADLAWQRQMIFYLRAETGEVCLAVEVLPSPSPSPSPGSSPLASPAPLTSWTPSSRDEIIARHVRTLSLTRRPDGLFLLEVETRVDDEAVILASTIGPLQEAAAVPPSPSPSTSAQP